MTYDDVRGQQMDEATVSPHANVVVVTDDRDLVSSLRAVLGGHTVTNANELAAGALTISDSVEVIMVEATAGHLRIAEQIRRSPDAPFLPMLALGPDTPSYRDRAHAAGAEEFIAVPLDPALTLQRMTVWRGVHRRDSAAQARLAGAQHLAALEDELTRRTIHDLISPVAGIEGFLRLLQRDPGSAEAPAMIDQALRAVAILRTQVEDLQRIRMLEAGTLTPTSVATDLHALATSTVEALASAAARREISLAVDGEPMDVTVDPLLLGRALEHIVTGALRAAPRRSAVTVTLRREAAGVAIQVADQGASIDASDRSALFTRHTRNLQRSGLYLASLVSSLHRGTISVLDRDDRGTIVRVTLPDRLQ